MYLPGFIFCDLVCVYYCDVGLCRKGLSSGALCCYTFPGMALFSPPHKITIYQVQKVYVISVCNLLHLYVYYKQVHTMCTGCMPRSAHALHIGAVRPMAIVMYPCFTYVIHQRITCTHYWGILQSTAYVARVYTYIVPFR